MKLIFITSTFIFLIYPVCFSQELINTDESVTTGQIYTFDRGEKTILGSPYLEDNFTNARISVSGDKLYSIRYNMVNDEMELQNKKSEIQAINKSIDNLSIYFLNNKKVFKVFDYLNHANTLHRGYFRPISDFSNSESGIVLLLKESKQFIKSEPAGNGYQEEKPASYIREKDKFYIKVKSKPAIIIPKNKKAFVKIFPEFESDILLYIKKNKIKTSKKNDLIQLTIYINDLYK